MPKKKSAPKRVSQKPAKSIKTFSAVSQNRTYKAPKWYVLTSFAISIILLFIYFIEYVAVNPVISIFIGILLTIWFLMNAGMLIIFLKRKVGYKALIVSIVFFVYFAIMFFNGLIFGLTEGEVTLISDSLSNNIEIVSIVLIIVFSLIIWHKRDYN